MKFLSYVKSLAASTPAPLTSATEATLRRAAEDFAKVWEDAGPDPDDVDMDALDDAFDILLSVARRLR